MSFFRFESLSKKFNERILFDNISFDFPNTGLVVLLGKSGSGKTTLFNILSGLEKMDEGKIFYKDKELKSQKDFAYFRQEISFVFQEYGILNYLNGYDNLALGGFSNFKLDDQNIISTENFEKKSGLLSGGEKQRLAILKAISKDSSIIFCDEPTGALDEATSKNIMNIITEVSKNKLVIMVTHNIELANEYGDIILELKDLKLNLIKEKKIKTKRSAKDNKIKVKFNPLKGIKIACKSFFEDKMKILISFLSLSLSLVSLFVVGSLNENSYNSIQNNIATYADYKRLKVSEIIEQKIENTSFSLSKTKCPSIYELEMLVDEYALVNYSFDSFFDGAKVLCNNKEYDATIIVFPFGNSNDDIRINSELYDLINEKEIEISININKNVVSTYRNNVVEDTVSFEIVNNVKVIYDEFSFLNSSCIFVSHNAVEKYLKTIKLKHLSNLVNSDFVSLYDRYTSFINKEDSLTNYCMYVDVMDKRNVENVIQILSNYKNNNIYYDVTSRAKITSDTLSSSLNLLSMLMSIFGIISLLVSIILLYLFINSRFESRKKEFALYKSYGFRFMDYYYYNFIPFSICLTISLCVSLVLYNYIKDLIGMSLMDFFGFNIFENDRFIFENFAYIISFLLFFCLLFSLYPSYRANLIKISEVIKSE